ncbi:MAG: Fe-S cluster assembly protein SufD [Limimaricola sp.]|uniref:Fe-S cluster assembly protein SufD n=1 Tax=Limimaricola sp. TaxID=2211665 RepID=UPI001D44AB62|nr:Fe-S cluster assembly protein SufD [Limimaricola sp.]MBI1418177.1 Fe-S cluster assembly protein SufD [Limimaricola sp.]
MALAKRTTDPALAALELPQGGAWASEARQAARARLAEMGLPGRRDEYWRYTDPTTLISTDPTPAKVGEADDIFAGTNALRLVFVDGVFDADASDGLDESGVEILQLADVTAKDIHWVKEFYGVLEAAGQVPVARPLAALNTATATQGAVIRATGKVSRPVHLIYLRRDETAEAVMHHVVRIEPGADLTLLESGAGAARLSTVMEVDVAEGAAFHHVRLQGRDHERRAATHCFARVAADARFKSFTLTLNGAMTRNETVLTLKGDGGVAHVAGAVVGDGDDFHQDDTVFVTHDAVGCESRQVFKKVLRNGATGVFQGKILVKPGAQKTDGYQISQSLLLDDDSRFLAKPELEIYADDVACSHGSTSGAIDDTALFYLRSRGVPERTATMLLTLAFLAESLAEIDDPALAEELRDRLEGWLARHH